MKKNKIILLITIFAVLLVGCSSQNKTTSEVNLATSEVNLLDNKLKVALPLNWIVKVIHASEVSFEDSKGIDKGGLRIVCYYPNNYYSSLPMNHSLIKSEEDIIAPLGKSKLFVLERESPITSEIQEKRIEIHIIIPINNNKEQAFDFWMREEESVEKTKELLKQIAKQTILLDN